jgi:hypothetical protein
LLPKTIVSTIAWLGIPSNAHNTQPSISIICCSLQFNISEEKY